MRTSRYLAIAAALALCAQYAASPQVAPAQRSAIVRLPSIRTLSMMTPTAGWALEASAILHTTDGGTSWEPVSPAGVPIIRIWSIFALDARTAWVTISRPAPQGPAVVHTTNDGRTWRTTSLPLPDDADGLGPITFADARHGWLLVSLGAGVGSEGVQILGTGDGGAHWLALSRTASADPAPGSLPLSGIKTGLGFRDTTTGWVTAAVAGPADSAWLYRTRDAGYTWQHQSLQLPTSYQQVAPALYPPRFFTPRGGVLPVVLLSQTGIPTLDFFTTRDGGVTWSTTTPFPSTAVAGSPVWAFADPAHGWAALGTQLFSTTDGGRHWSKIDANLAVGIVTQLDFVNAQDGWLLGAVPVGTCVGECLRGRGPLAGAPLLRTVNGGRTWTRLGSKEAG